MSASLVGSEMCIRDSRAQPRAPREARAPDLCGDIRPADRLAHDLPGGPVSYTHLTLPTICSV
eukprot:6463170-Alexandrium_andersonii.AAC.1